MRLFFCWTLSVVMLGQTLGLLTKNSCHGRVLRCFAIQTTPSAGTRSGAWMKKGPFQNAPESPRRRQATKIYSNSRGKEETMEGVFRRGMPVTVEVMSFGPLGASIDVVAKSHDPEEVIKESEEALGAGLISQQEIHYFRSSRNGLDVVLGEILKAYVTHVREDGKLAIGLRSFGGKEKATELGAMIMEWLETEGEVPVGDKSPPREIERIFPGASKTAFKQAVAALYKERKATPGPFSVIPYAKNQDNRN